VVHALFIFLSYAFFSYPVIDALVHHQQIKDHPFGSSIQVLKHVLKYYGIDGKTMEQFRDHNHLILDQFRMVQLGCRIQSRRSDHPR
jgi:hypothetical protein